MLACNAISVSAFLIYYTKVIVDLVIESEKKLNSIANIDLLTDLYSRRYMINYLEEYDADDEGWLAMADVDDFKKINDTYGHNCGDYVLNFHGFITLLGGKKYLCTLSFRAWRRITSL